MSRIWSVFKLYHRIYIHNCTIQNVAPQTSYFVRGRCFSNRIGSDLKENFEYDGSLLANGDEALLKKLKILALEVDILRQEGERVPSELQEQEWKELASLETHSARRKYLQFCWIKRIKKENKKHKKDEERMEYQKMLKEREKLPQDPMDYKLGGNSILMRIGDTTMNTFFNSRLIQAMQFGQEIVVDCGYDGNMTTREAINCGKQLMMLFAKNRANTQPFNVLFCNANREGRTMKEFVKIVKTAYNPEFPLHITEKNYLDLFPKERLVYLTPHCREELNHFDHDAVYIIGGLVDKSVKVPLSLGKAKEQGLKMAKLPLDKYLTFASGGGKSLTLDQMISVMLDIKQTGDWNIALKHVPRRKLQKIYPVDFSSKKFKLLEGDTFKGLVKRAVSK